MGNKAWMLLATLMLLLSACGGGGGDYSSRSSGTLSVSLTDAPVTEAEKVVIYFTNIRLHGADGSATDIPIIDPVTKVAGRSIDLLQLQGDKSLVLFDKELPTGVYSWMRLEVDFDPSKTYIQIGGAQHALRCTSCENNGYKLNRSVQVEQDAVMAYTLDFDLRKSITFDASVYHLRPTVRVVESSVAGHLGGTVDGTLIAGLGGETGCMVYVYDGHDVTPNDIYLPNGLAIPETHHNPVATAVVEATTHDYTVGFLAAGNYSVALTCDGENDDILTQDPGVSFHNTANITITAGTTLSHDIGP